jgi:hypothetical protein
MGKFIITEEEKKHILGLYKLIVENIDPETGGSVRIDNFYPAGYYTLNNTDTKDNQLISKKLDDQLKIVTDFVKNNPKSIVSVKFVSGESAIPNYDNEGKENKKRTKLEVGDLSKLRKQYLQTYITQYFNNLKSTGIISQEVVIPEVQYEEVPPKTPWVGTPFCPTNSTPQQQVSTCVRNYQNGVKQKNKDILPYKEKYDSEQFSYIEISVIKSSTPETTVTTTTTLPPLDCATNLKIRIFVKTHNCQNAEFFIYANNVQLQNVAGGNTANMNNADSSMGIPAASSQPKISKKYLNPGFGNLKNGDETVSYGFDKGSFRGDIGGSRSDTFIITEEQSKKIVSEGKGKISIWMIATTSVAHKDLPNVEITKNGKVIYNGRPKIVQGKLITLNACGDKVLSEGTSDEVPQMDSARDNHRKERVAMQGDIDLSGEVSDEKQEILTRSNDLVVKMRDLVRKIKKWRNNANLPENRNEVEKYYNEFQPMITSEPSLEKKDGKYVNKKIRGDMYGDVRIDMDYFYRAYDAIYLNPSTKVYYPKGRPGFQNIILNLAEYKDIV